MIILPLPVLLGLLPERKRMRKRKRKRYRPPVHSRFQIDAVGEKDLLPPGR